MPKLIKGTDILALGKAMAALDQAACGLYNPCEHAQRLEARAEEDRGRRDQQITALERELKEARSLLLYINEAFTQDELDHIGPGFGARVAAVARSMYSK